MPMPTAEDDERARDGATFRWAIAGSGLIAADFAYALSVTPGATLVAVAARTTERAAAFAASASVLPGAVAKANAAAAAAGGPAVTASTIRTYGSYAELAADANVDVVYVATTNPQHVPVASLFVEAKRVRGVVVEKPCDVRADGARALAAAAKTNGIFLMEGLWTRFLPAVRALRRAIHDEGAIGDIVSVHADFGFLCDDKPDSRMYARELGGGSLLDIGIYPLSFASLAYGGARPSKVAALGALTPSGVDDAVVVSLAYPTIGGASVESGVGWPALDAPPPPPPADVDASGAAAPPPPRAAAARTGLAMVTSTLRGETPEEVVIVGTKGRARVLGPAHIAAALELTTARGGRGAVETERLDYPLPPLPPADVATLNYPGSQAFCYQAAAVQGCLARGELESAEHPNDEMLALLETMDVIRAQIGVEYD